MAESLSGSSVTDQRGVTTVGTSYTNATGAAPMDSEISSIWWVRQGQGETLGDRGINGTALIDCNGYFAIGGDVDGAGGDFRNVRRTRKDKERWRTELLVKPSAEQPVNSPEAVSPLTLQYDQHTRDMTELGKESDGIGRRPDPFVRTTDDDCDAVWASWPAVQETAITEGSVLVFDIFPSVGNLFVALHSIVKVCRFLEVGLILNCGRFEPFRAAFIPGSIMWDLDPAPFVQQAEQMTSGAEAERRGLRQFSFRDGLIILSDSHLERVAQQMDMRYTSLDELAITMQAKYERSSKNDPLRKTGLRGLVRDVEKRLTENIRPCAWNMLLRRSPSMMASLEDHNPWAPSLFDSRPNHYAAWHIRTSSGETQASFNPEIHLRVFHDEPSEAVFPLFVSATDSARAACKRVFHEGIMPVYISSNSKSMASNCTALAAQHTIRAGYIDLGVSDNDAHTAFSKDPGTTALNAFIDYLYLMDASVIVQTGSSFPSTVASMKGSKCRVLPLNQPMPMKRMVICSSADC
ncbi:unnamed protein product [Ectocarpus sp. 12 AP-2014]